MSRVHLSYDLKSKSASIVIYEVISPDFSERGTEREVIGELTLDFGTDSFRYKPIERLKESFCPPEYFVKYSGDTAKVDAVCKEENLMCTGWSYRVYKKAEELLSSKSL